MKLTTKDIINQVKEFWNKQSKKARIIIAGSGGALVVLAVFLSMALNHQSFVTLYSGLEASEAGKITTRLTEMGETYKVGSAGTILVLKDREAQLKMSLASEGYPQTALNYDIFSSNSSFMTTDYEKRKYLVFQLQNRLQDAIKTIQGIESTIVTISLPEEDSFVLQEDKVPATASVVLELSGAVTLEKQQIKGIEELVAKSVPGLEGKNVAIIDDQGEMLNNQYESGSEGVAYTRLELEKNISQAMESRLTKLLQPVFGVGGFRVAVNTSVDTNKKTSEATTYTPVVGENGIVSQIDESRKGTGAQGAVGGVAGTGSNTGVPTYPETAGEENDGTYSESSSRDYLVNQLKEQVEHDGYEIRDLSVAVIVGQELNADQIGSYKEMLAYATGVETDKIVISTAKFLGQGEEAADADSDGQLLTKPQLLILAGACGLVLIIAVILLLMLRKRKKHKKGKPGELDEENIGLEEALSAVPDTRPIPGQIVLNETREQALKRQIKEFAAGNPEIVAQLLRTWIKEDDTDE